MQSKRSGSSRAGGVGTTLSLVLLATLLTAAAALFSFKNLQPDIETDLTARVATALQGGNANNFFIDGQDVILSGAVGSEAASLRAAESAASVYGVNRVINNLIIGDGVADADLAPDATVVSESSQTESLIIDGDDATATPSTLTLASRNGKISAQGIIADDATIERINTALIGKFGRGNVKNELSSFAGSTSPEWLAGMLSMIDQLDGIDDPILKVTGSDFIIGGTVNAEQIRNVKVATARRLLGAELNVIDNLNVEAPVEPGAEIAAAPELADEPVTLAEETAAEPTTEPAALPDAIITDTATTTAVATNTATTPASIEILSDNNQITLTGFVGSDTDANALREGLDNLFGVNGYEDELTVSDTVEAAAWIEDALIVTSEVRDVPNFSVNIRAGQMSLSGNLEDRESGRDLSIAATEIAGQYLGVLNNFSVAEVIVSNSDEDLLGQSLMQELDALPTSKILFNKNSTTLTDSAMEVLDDVAAAIRGYSDLVVEIAGHTDSSGDAVTNLRLSKERAAAVRDYLVEKNVPANRLSPIGYGETAPIRDNESDTGRAANRRIEFNL